MCLTAGDKILCRGGVIRASEPMSTQLLSLPASLMVSKALSSPLSKPHIHLDTTQTAGEPSWNLSGTLFGDRALGPSARLLLTHEDVKQRAIQTLKWQIANGIQFVRTHVDVSDPNLVALKAMLEVRGDEGVGELQIVAFPQEGILSYPNGKALLEEALKLGADVIGAIPISSLPGSTGSKVCTTSSILRRNIRFWWMCTATKSMTNSPVLSRRWQPWPTSAVLAIG